MALAHGGPTRSRTESLALVEEDLRPGEGYDANGQVIGANGLPIYDAYGNYGETNYIRGPVAQGSAYYNSGPVPGHTQSNGGVVSVIPGADWVANTNARGYRYVSNKRCSCPYIDGSD